MRNLDRLFEELVEATAARDLRYAQKAKAFVNKLDRFLRSKMATSKMSVQTGGPGIRSGEKMVTIYMDEINKKLAGEAPFIHIGKRRGSTLGSVKYDKQFDVFTVFVGALDDDSDPADYVYGSKKIKLTSGHKNTLAHEMIHLFDFMRGATHSVKSTEHFDAEYANSPMEYNAYFQAGLVDFMDLFSGRLRSLKRLSGRRKFVEAMNVAALLKETHSEFLELANKFGSWRSDWLELLNTRNRRKFKTRIYKLRQELIKELEASTKDLKMNHKELLAYVRKHHPQALRAGQTKGTRAHYEWPLKGSSRGRYTDGKK